MMLDTASAPNWIAALEKKKFSEGERQQRSALSVPVVAGELADRVRVVLVNGVNDGLGYERCREVAGEHEHGGEAELHA